MSWSSVALYTLTGTLTSPNAIEPFQMERMQSVCPYRRWQNSAAGRTAGLAGNLVGRRTRRLGETIQGEMRIAARSAARSGRSAPARATVSADDTLAASSAAVSASSPMPPSSSLAGRRPANPIPIARRADRP